MANLMGEDPHVLLENGFVFYQQLGNEVMYPPGTPQHNLYVAMMGKGREKLGIGDFRSRAQKIVTTLRRQAMNEGEKEIAMLNKEFNSNITLGDLYTQQIGKEIIFAVNEAMNLQKIFDRNINRILGIGQKGSKEKTTISSTLQSYIITELNQRQTEMLQNIFQNIKENFDFDYDKMITEAVDKELAPESTFINSVLGNALDKALSSSTWIGGEDEPLKEIADYLSKQENSVERNKLLGQMWENLGLKKFKNDLIEELRSKNNLAKEFKAKKGKILNMKAQTSINKGIKYGIMGEYFGNLISNIALETFHGDNYNYQSIHTGSTGQMKSDFTTAVGININPIESIASSSTFQKIEAEDSVRVLNRQRADAIQNYLETLHDGFLVYTNAKDYSLSTVNKYGGFSSGSNISLETYLNITESSRAGALVGAIANTIHGAVYEGESYERALSNYIAEDMAIFLFDDAMALGNAMSKNSANAVHLMYLNGVYIPLSYFMYLLANAFESLGEEDYREIFNPQIENNISIKYPDGGEGLEGVNRWTAEDWYRQREEAWAKIKIGAHFSHNFVEMIQDLVTKELV